MLDKFVCDICKRHQPEGWSYWPSGRGQRPIFQEPEEPGWDTGTYQISTCAREAFPEEIRRDKLLKEREWERKRAVKYRVFSAAYSVLNWIADALHRMENGKWPKQ